MADQDGAWPGDERRREVRAKVSLGAELKVAGKTYLVEVQALSLQGAYLQFMDADPFPHEGQALLVPGGLGEGIEVAVRRKVQDDDGLVTGLGLEFLSLGPAARAYVTRVVDEANR